MKSENYIKNYIKSKNLRYQEFLKVFKKNFIYQRKYFLNAVCIALNDINYKKYNHKDYNYLISPWLDEFTKIYLLRKFHYFKIKKKLSISNNIKILINNDFSDFITNSNNINFNLNFFQSFNSKKKILIKKYIRKNIKKNFYQRLKFNICIFFIKFFINKKTTLLINSRFNKVTIIKLMILSKFKILPFFHYNQYFLDIPNPKLNKSLRAKFQIELEKNMKKNDASLISESIPSAYLENFDYHLKFSNKIFSKKPMNIFTTTSHLDDEILKFSLMNWGYKNKPNILISQHGGNYSISNQLGLGHYDYEISKKYFTWGFKSRKNHVISNAQQIYQKVQNYNKEKEIHKKQFLTFILGPNMPNDFQRYVYQNVNYKILYKNRSEFVQNYKNKKKIMFKKYYLKRYPQQDNDMIIKNSTNIQYNQITNDIKIIYKSKILIFDYFSTMFFEIINMDIPFIFILNEKDFYLSNTGKKLMKILKKNNLLFASGKDAAIYLNKIHSYEDWWKEINKKDLKIIKNKIANIRFNNLNFWYQQFKN